LAARQIVDRGNKDQPAWKQGELFDF